MRISDWSSDVCSSDLSKAAKRQIPVHRHWPWRLSGRTPDLVVELVVADAQCQLTRPHVRSPDGVPNDLSQNRGSCRPTDTGAVPHNPAKWHGTAGLGRAAPPLPPRPDERR